MKEIWKDITGYDGLYQVSNFGRVRSTDREVTQYNNGTMSSHIYKGKILNGSDRGNGYIRVHVSKDGHSTQLAVHRLVAEAFCDKPEGCDVVNHLDCNPSNNRADNLEWTTYKGNMQYASSLGRMHYHPNNLKKAQESRKVPVIATKNGVDYYFDSQADAAKALGVQQSHIGCICKGRYGYKSSGGYKFRYA